MADGASPVATLLASRPSPPLLSYGTAGFRGPASTLHEAVLRCGILAAFRSHVLHNRPVGLMVTASHNPAHHNGLKIVEPDGAMLDAAWEAAANAFVNAKQDPLHSLSHLVDAHRRLVPHATVVIGWDTRASAAQLVALARRGAESTAASVELLGLVTTPQLHFSLRARHHGQSHALSDYSALLVGAHSRMVARAGAPAMGAIAVDCACGVGAAVVEAVREALSGGVHVLNRPSDGVLNEQCGADFVQKTRQMPVVYGRQAPKCRIWASLDGDADRLVMFEAREEGVVVADGDRFAVLVARFVTKHVKCAGVKGLTVAVAQTAYSNGAAAEALVAMEGVEVVVARTGVKHLEKAVREFDVGIYWEPNGHGTVLYSDRARAVLAAAANAAEDCAEGSAADERAESVCVLRAMGELANQAVGDGVADLLLVLGISAVEGMGWQEWLGMYEERCSSNLVVEVKDKGVIVTEDCDRMVKEPVALREAVLKAARGEGCRAFVRPSGTEDVVRVYAEAPAGCMGKAKAIGIEVARAVYDYCGGVGDRR